MGTTTWEPAVLTVRGWNGDWYAIGGYQRDIWGIYRELLPLGDVSAVWRVCHLPSGMGVEPMAGYDERVDAERLVDALAPLTDWDRVQTIADILPALLPIIAAVRMSPAIWCSPDAARGSVAG